MVAPKLICPSAVHIEANPVANRSAECRAVCRADALVFAFDGCHVFWPAKYPIITFAVCLACRLGLDLIPCDVICCAHNYLIPFIGLGFWFIALISSCRSICQSNVWIDLSQDVPLCIASICLDVQAWKMSVFVCVSLIGCMCLKFPSCLMVYPHSSGRSIGGRHQICGK